MTDYIAKPKLFDEELGIEGYIDQKGVYHKMPKREKNVPLDIPVDRIVDYEKSKEDKRIEDKRPTLNINKIPESNIEDIIEPNEQ